MTTKQWGRILAVSVAILTWIATGSVTLPVGIPADWLPIIKSWSIFALALWNTINVFLPADVVPLPKSLGGTGDGK